MQVRPYRPSDAAALSELYRRSVKAIGPDYYTSEQVQAWASITPAADRLDALYSDGRVALVAVDAQDTPIGFSDLEANGHIEFLYCAPQSRGQGAAYALYQQLQRAAVERGLKRMFVEASEAAVPFFKRQGFIVVARRDLFIGDGPIHNFAMEKQL